MPIPFSKWKVVALKPPFNMKFCRRFHIIMLEIQLEDELSAAFNAAAYRNDTATVRDYFDRVYEWMYKNYRVKPEKTPPVLFQQPCIR